MEKGDLIIHKRDQVLGIIVYIFQTRKDLVEVVWADGYRSDIRVREVEVMTCK